MADKPAAPSPTPTATPDSVAVTPALQDKGLWVAVIATVLAPLAGWLSLKLGIAVDPTSLATFIVSSILPLITYIVMHKYKSGQIIVAETAANANVAATQIQADAMTSSARAAEILNALFPNGLPAGAAAGVGAPTAPAAVPVPTVTFTAPKATVRDLTSAQAAPIAHALPAPKQATVELASALNGPVSTLTETLVPTMPSLAPTPSAPATFLPSPEVLMQLIPGLTHEQAVKMAESAASNASEQK